jgi:hypothetical protein
MPSLRWGSLLEEYKHDISVFLKAVSPFLNITSAQRAFWSEISMLDLLPKKQGGSENKNRNTRRILPRYYKTRRTFYVEK